MPAPLKTRVHAAFLAGLSVLAVSCDRRTPAPAASETVAVPAASPSASALSVPAAAASSEPACPCVSVERCERGTCVPNCPDGEVYVAATGPSGFVIGEGKLTFGFGKFRGRHGEGTSDTPHRVVLTMPFCMDATEVTVAAMHTCVEHDGCVVPRLDDEWSTYRKAGNLPVNDTNWANAQHLCESLGKSLPTEAQWAWAATGGDGRAYPWGNERPTCELADFVDGPIPGPVGDFSCNGGGPSPVGTRPKGDRVLPTGRIHDLAGNVWEWTLDTYHPFGSEDVTDPIETARSDLHVIRGGGWNRSALGIRSTFRGGAIASYRVPGLGFRCVRNAAASR